MGPFDKKLVFKFSFLLCFLMVSICSGSVHALPHAEKIFIPNSGQWDSKAKYHMTIGQTDSKPQALLQLWLTENGYIYHISDLSQWMPITIEEAKPTSQGRDQLSGTSVEIPQHAVSVNFVGGQTPVVAAHDPVTGSFNWLIGPDASQHISSVTACRKVIYQNVYPGIDVIFDAATDARMLETTYRVEPGAKPEKIVLKFSGADNIGLNDSGSLEIRTSLGDITELCPIAFQIDSHGKHTPVQAAFILKANQLSFRLGDYDKARTLYIDPEVVFSHSFGGSGNDHVCEMHEDASGRYITGFTYSSDFPDSENAFQSNLIGSIDLFAVKFSLDNETLLWATYIGGSGVDYGGNSALASDGSLYLVSSTQSNTTWPMGSTSYTYGSRGSYDIGVVHLSSNGQNVIAGAVLGGTSIDHAGDIEIDSQGIVVCGSILSVNFPTTPGGYDTVIDGQYDAFVLRLNAALSSYLDFTFIPGGSWMEGASSIAFDGSGNVYVCGILNFNGSYASTATIGPGGNHDLFVAKYDQGLDNQFYNARIGGTSTDPIPGFGYTSAAYSNIANSNIIIDSSNRAWVTGGTASSDFPIPSGGFQQANGGNYDTFVIALNSAGTAIDYGTFLGGESTDNGQAIRFDSMGNIYVVSLSASTDYPLKNAVQATNAGNYDLTLSVLSPDLGDLIFSTYWGGSSTEFAADVEVGPDYTARVAGTTYNPFPQFPEGSTVFGPGGSYDGALVSFDFRDLIKPQSIPTMTEWGIIICAVLLGSVAIFTIRRRQPEISK